MQMEMGFAIALLLSALLLHCCLAQQGFTSIDCGSSSSYEGSNGISWQADPNTSPDTAYTLPPKILETVRFFPQTFSSSNCYSLTVVPNRRHLLRASFYYGNYDALSYAPTFSLYIDGSFWTGVSYDPQNSDNRLGYYMIKEIIWRPSQTSSSICLKSNSEDVPFISALESRILPLGSYEMLGYGNSSFHMLHRNNLGGRSLVRYPSDKHDRFWFGVPQATAGFTAIKTDKTISPRISANDKPPLAVFNSAFEGQKNQPVVFYELDLETHLRDFYVTLWFVDFRERRSSDVCSFDMGLEIDANFGNTTITVESGFVSGWTHSFFFPTSLPKRKLRIALRPTARSTLPPLINAIEVYAAGPKIDVQASPNNLEKENVAANAGSPSVSNHLEEENVVQTRPSLSEEIMV